jgi:hypothetical protein
MPTTAKSLQVKVKKVRNRWKWCFSL